MWRCILRRITTLYEVDTHWSLPDLVRANQALDVEDEMERLRAQEK